MKTTISVEEETRKKLAILRETHDFQTYDSLLLALIKNQEKTRKVLKGIIHE